MNKVLRDHVHLELGPLALTMVYPEQRSIRCPFHGSANKDLSLTKTESGLVYFCFSPKCGISGFIPTRPSVPILQRSVVPPEAQFDIPQYAPLGPEHKAMLRDKYELHEHQLLINGLGVVGDYIYIPLNSLQCSQIGYQLRRYQGSGPKAKTCWRGTQRATQPISHTIPGSTQDMICLTEDFYSALKLSEWVPTMPLLGTHLELKSLSQLARTYRRLLLALDPDPAGDIAALKILTDARYVFRHISVLPLTLDPKDTSRKQLIDYFERLD